MNEIGAFRGTTLIHRESTIGGAKGVFVKLKGIKNDLVYPTFGGEIKNPFKSGGKFFAGDLIEFRTNQKGVNPEVYILKTYLVESVSGNVVNIVKDGYKHVPCVGDVLGVAPEKIGGAMTSATITKVETTDVAGVKVWACTFSKAVDATKGAILVEADEEGNMLVKNINAVADSDADLLYAPSTGDNDFDGARYHYVPALGGTMYIHKMSPVPACVIALNKSRINGWFEV